MAISDNPFSHGRHNKLLVLLVKGNLVNRIEKLGEEIPRSGRSPAQQKLSQIAEDQRWGSDVKISIKTGLPQPSRPLWAKGAFMYCNRLDAYALKLLVDQSENGVIDEGIGKLQSKYIVCSSDVWPIVEEVLKTEQPHDPSESGRHRFLRQKSSVVQKIYAVTLPNYVTLSDDVWKASDVLNEDQLEYLTTLISTQKMEPEVLEELYVSLAEHLPDCLLYTSPSPRDS